MFLTGIPFSKHSGCPIKAFAHDFLRAHAKMGENYLHVPNTFD